MENEKNECFDMDVMPDDAPSEIISIHSENNMVFTSEHEEILTVLKNGDILVRGKVPKNDKEIVDAFREYALTIMKNNIY